MAPRHVKRIVHALPGGLGEWCYFGADGRQMDVVSEHLRRVERASIGAELNQVARSLKQPFLDWIAEIGRRQRNKLNWWASRLASKSPLQTDFFLLVVCTQLVNAWLETAREPSPRVLVVEDPWLRWVFRRKLAGDARVAFYGGWLGDCILDTAYWLARVPLAVGYALLSSLWIAAVTRLVGPVRGKDGTDPGKPWVLIYTWLDDRCFSRAGTFHDPYTGRLEKILRARGEDVRRLAPVAAPRRLLIRTLKEFPDLFVAAPRHVRLRDNVRAAFGWLTISGLRRLSTFQEWDYAPLLYREVLREWGSTGIYQCRLWYFGMRRVAETFGPGVKCLIYPFENQPWEKLLCLAWRDCAPHVTLIGYQHSSVQPLLLPFFLGRGELESVPLPDRIVANGQVNLELLREGGFPAARLANGGALRYEYMHVPRAAHSGRRSPANARREGEEKVVLVTFPISPQYARRLVVDLLEEFSEPLHLDKDGGAPVRFVLKCHPVLPMEKFHLADATLPPWITVSREPLDRLLSRADLLLYVPPTTTRWEGFLTGIPVLKYQVDLLDIDSDAVDGVPVPVCSRETLRASVGELLRDPPVGQRLDPRVLEGVFGRVDEDLWARIVGETAS